MRRSMQFIVALALVVPSGGGLAWAFDYRIDPNAAHRSEFRLAFASKSPLSAYAGAMDTLKAGVPSEYASAMTWYRIALTSGSQPPLVAADWIYGDQLPEPLQWAWSAENGDLIARVGKGSFRLSFADSGNNWFRDLDCRMVLWPGGDLQATMNCDDGTQRTMLIPEDGVVVVNDARYARAFKTQPLPPPEEGDLPPDTDPASDPGTSE